MMEMETAETGRLYRLVQQKRAERYDGRLAEVLKDLRGLVESKGGG